MAVVGIVKAGVSVNHATKCKAYKTKTGFTTIMESNASLGSNVLQESNALQGVNGGALRHTLTLLVLLGLAVVARIPLAILDLNSLGGMLFLALFTVVALYLTLLRLGANGLCAALVTAIFCLHSTFADMQMNGLATSLNVFMLLLLLNAFLTVFENPAVAASRYVFFGVVAAATFLVREDSVIALLLLFAAMAWVSRKHIALCWPRLLLGGLVALLLISPRLLWNQTNFEGLIQEGSKIEPMYFYDGMQNFAKLFISPVGDASLIAGIFLAVWIVIIYLLVSDRRTMPSSCALAIFCIAVFAVFCYQTGFNNFVHSGDYMLVGLMGLLSVAGLIRRSPSAIGTSLLLVWLVSALWLYSPVFMIS
jgi:hypothetical protein